MDIQFWLDKWQDKNIGFNQNSVNPWLKKYLSSLDLKPGAHIFVPLCGKSIDMHWLLAQGFNVIGVEVSSLACEEFFADFAIEYSKQKQGGFTRYTSLTPGVILYCGDFFALPRQYLSNVSAVYDRAALIALPVVKRKVYVEHLLAIIPKHTKILMITLDYEQSTMSGPPFAVPNSEINDLFISRFSIKNIDHAKLQNIAEHLKQRGLQDSEENVFY